MKPVVAAVLHFGYAESGKVSPLILTYRGQEKLSSPEEAVKSIAKYFREKYAEDQHGDAGKPWVIRVRKCCVATKEKVPEAHFCGCDSPLTPEAFDAEDFQDWLYDIVGFNNDRYGYYEGDWWEHDGIGELMALPKESVIEIPEYAEVLITDAIDSSLLTGESLERYGEWKDEHVGIKDSRTMAKRVSEKSGRFQ